MARMVVTGCAGWTGPYLKVRPEEPPRLNVTGRPINERHAPGDSRALYPNGGPHAADPGADAAASLRGAEANEANAASAVPD